RSKGRVSAAANRARPASPPQTAQSRYRLSGSVPTSRTVRPVASRSHHASRLTAPPGTPATIPPGVAATERSSSRASSRDLRVVWSGIWAAVETVHGVVDTEPAREVKTGVAAEVHVRRRPGEDDLEAVQGSPAHARRPFAPLPAEPAPPLELAEHAPADVVPGVRVLGAGVAQADDQS